MKFVGLDGSLGLELLLDSSVEMYLRNDFLSNQLIDSDLDSAEFHPGRSWVSWAPLIDLNK